MAATYSDCAEHTQLGVGRLHRRHNTSWALLMRCQQSAADRRCSHAIANIGKQQSGGIRHTPFTVTASNSVEY
jgi:hypothetical protein